jgi:hypothetical protein
MLLLCLRPRTSTIPSESVVSFLDDYMATCEGDAARDRDPEYRTLRAQLLEFGAETPLRPLDRWDEIVPATR